MELLRISIENVLFHLSELFSYLNKVILLLGQRGSDNRGRTVSGVTFTRGLSRINLMVIPHHYQSLGLIPWVLVAVGGCGESI